MKKLQIGKGRSRSFLFAAALTLTLLALAGCTDITNPPPFVPVTDITGVPATGTAGTEVDLSNAKVVPADASYQVITWTVADAGATGVTDTGIVKGKFTPTGAGRLVLTATVPNGKAEGDDFTRQFEITISAAAVAVTGIANVPSTAYVGYSL
ncbi:MAG: hypothetical protein LBQ30_03875, partial [Treponema sp.]|nr:hypothetical protein [Treponema sp.]